MTEIDQIIQEERAKRIKNISFKDWEEGTMLGCPKLRAHRTMSSIWMALDRDPCPTKECKMYGCHNYGGKFDEPKRLVIVVSKIDRTKEAKCADEKM